MLKVPTFATDDLNMESSSRQPIRLSDNETELLTRALAEAQQQAEVPTAGESETQFLLRAETDADRRVLSAPRPYRDSGNMIL